MTVEGNVPSVLDWALYHEELWRQELVAMYVIPYIFNLGIIWKIVAGVVYRPLLVSGKSSQCPL